uniref:AAA domain-containing protein n=1 Tax=Macrostomum lignano TaxID=282301 RepID=A0A1I8IQ23_9PLAT
MSDLWSGRSRGLPRPDVNAPEREAFRTEDASSSTLEADCFNPGGAAVQCGTDLFRLYMRHKIVDANLSLNHCSYRLSVLEQLAKHKLRYLKQLETVAEKLEDSPRYVALVQSVLGRQMVRIKLGSESFVVTLRERLPLADKIRPNCKVGIRFTPTGGMEIYRVFSDVQDPLVSLMLVQKDTESTYEMIGGLERQIREIKEVVELPILHPELFTSLGISQPKGVLLYGPPGTGKTMLARAVAHHTKCAFFKLSGTELVQKYIGEGARLMRELFILARQKAPSIIFLDEVDSIGTKAVGRRWAAATAAEEARDPGHQPHRHPGRSPDPARPGGPQDFLPAANLDGRVDILRIHSRRMNLGARRLSPRRGRANARSVGRRAEAHLPGGRVLGAARGRQFVTQEDFLQRIDKVMKSLSAKRRVPAHQVTEGCDWWEIKYSFAAASLHFPFGLTV